MIGKLLKHLREGDLFRVARNYMQHSKIWDKIKAWRLIKASCEAVIVFIGKNSRLKLYTDSMLSEPIFTGNFEPSELHFVQAYLKKNDHFLDVGANIGLFTVIAAEKVGAEGKIYSFEPVTKTFDRLRENIELNQLAMAFPVHAALSSSDGELDMVVSIEGYDAWNSFGKPSAGTGFATEAVKVIKLDSWLAQHPEVKPALIKIDVEGWEGHVLQGGNGIFSAAHAPDLLVEFTESNCKNAGTSCSELYDTLSNLGYQVFTYDHALNRLVPEPRREVYPPINVVASKNPAALQQRLVYQVSSSG